MLKVLSCLLLSPIAVMAAVPVPVCSFVIQSSQPVASGSVGELTLIPCAAVRSSLPNAAWLVPACQHYKTSVYPYVLLESINSVPICKGLANQKEGFYFSNSNQYAVSKNATPAPLTDQTVVMHYPQDFIIQQ